MMSAAINGDICILARGFEPLDEPDARSRGRPVVELADVNSKGRGETLAFGVDRVAVGKERKERPERGPPARREGLACPYGGGAQGEDAAVREAHERDPSGIDSGMRGKSSKSAVCVGYPLSSRQEPRVRTDFGQPAPTEAIDDERRVSPLSQCPRPLGVDRSVSTAAMRDHHRREGPLAGRESELPREHHRIPGNEPRAVGRARKRAGGREPDLAGVGRFERRLELLQRGCARSGDQPYQGQDQEPSDHPPKISYNRPPWISRRQRASS